jgi:putative nucleotidyltransferase with HDIG domain
MRGVEQIDDFDIVLAGDAGVAARALARSADAAAFMLSDEFGAWRVVARSGAWQADLNPLRGEDIAADLVLRDFTVNAIAEPLNGGSAIDPLDGARDLELGRLRLAAPNALATDPLRAMRLVRLSCELGLEPDSQAREAARAVAPLLVEVAAERVYLELRRIVASQRASAGIRMTLDLGLAAAVLPELVALDGLGQTERHHLDALQHTLLVLDGVVALDHDAQALWGESAADVVALLREPLADGVDRGCALRFGALFHDIAKPATRAADAAGTVTFFGHDELGADVARSILRRLRAAERVQSHVAALTREHLRLGFIVARQPLTRAELYGYLDTCGAVAPDVTLLSVADRMATRGTGTEREIARHLELAQAVLPEALRWHRDGVPVSPIRGDVLARALDVPLGPQIGALLALLAQARFTGEVETEADAVAFARTRIA